jgi:hypothetical protein
MKKAPQSLRSPTSLFCIALLTSLATTASGGSWIDLVSVSSTGDLANDDSELASISDDGRYVAFGSNAFNLIPGDVYYYPEVYLRDTVAGTTIRINVDTTGGEPVAGASYNPAVSGDGRYVAFDSGSSSLVTGDTNATYDVFVRDTVSNTTTRVSVDSAGIQANNTSTFPAISADGRYVAFVSIATNLVPGGTSGDAHIYVHDRDTGATSLVSVDSGSTEGNDGSGPADISGDGRYVAFESRATNLVPGGTNQTTWQHIFVHDRDTGTTSLVSADSAGNDADTGSGDPTISHDGRYIAFTSYATNLVTGDTNATYDVFVRDTVSNTTTRVSVDSAGNQGTSTSYRTAISGDGRYVAFNSFSPNLVVNDGNGFRDIFLHDRNTGVTSRVSVDEAGGEANSHSNYPLVSADGRYVAFTTFANNLVAGDSNARTDAFIKAIPQVEVTSVVPDSLPRGQTTSVTISGTYFLPGAVPELPNASTSNVVISNESTMTTDFTVPSNAPTGKQDVSVNLPGTGPGLLTGSVATCVDCVTVPAGC